MKLKFLFIIMLLSPVPSCVSHKKLLNDASVQITGQCLDKLEQKFRENNCFSLEVYREKDQVVFRCDKIDKKRKNFWDKWWFILTRSGRNWPPELLNKVNKHTICIDGRYRLEAYPPEK